MNKKKRPLSLIAKDFFDYLGRHLPQQCASDEFYFLPRSEVAVKHLLRLDDLTQDKIQDHIRYVKDLLLEISNKEQDELEEEIDRLFLKQGMEGFIREFGDAEVWRNDPTLYAKIPLFAIDQVISRRDNTPGQLKSDLSTLFKQIPSFLGLAVENLYSPSEISLRIAVNMAEDAIQFHNHDIRTFVEKKMGEDEGLLANNRAVLEAWEQYKRDLLGLAPRGTFAIGEDRLREILAVSLSYRRSPKEISEIADDAYQKTRQKLITLARKIDSRKSWDLIIHEQLPSIASRAEFFQLFKREVQDLRRFFYSQDIISFPSGDKIDVVKTPSYLQSFRATASYRAPLTGNTKDHGLFYLTPGNEDLELISSHAPYLTAHETYPGHHILDHIRINHSNPIRRQFESPLFYEGWACYSEQLLDEMGYIQDPRTQLIGLKRQLWRIRRAALDVELQTGKITLEEGAKMIEALGYSSERARRQIRRFATAPGYQLCYFMGVHEINQLYKKFSPQLGLKSFYDTLLGGGEIPFLLVEKRLEARMV